MAKILITGIAGFIGSHLAERLFKDGHEVAGIDNFSTGKTQNLSPDIPWIHMDITDNLAHIFENWKPEYVFHLAAQINLRDSFKNPLKDAETNVLGSLNLIQNSIKYKIKKFIFSSTGGAIYSPKAPLPWQESDLAEPQSPYGLSKLTIEKYLEIYKNDLNYVALRYSNVFGPRQNSKGEAGVISIFLDNIKNNKELIVFGNGKQTRDFIYVDDVVEANLLALNDNITGIFNVSSNTQTSINELISLIKNETNSSVAVNYKEAIEGELKDSLLDYSKINSMGWEPKYNLIRGIKNMLSF